MSDAVDGVAKIYDSKYGKLVLAVGAIVTIGIAIKAKNAQSSAVASNSTANDATTSNTSVGSIPSGYQQTTTQNSNGTTTVTSPAPAPLPSVIKLGFSLDNSSLFGDTGSSSGENSGSSTTSVNQAGQTTKGTTSSSSGGGGISVGGISILGGGNSSGSSSSSSTAVSQASSADQYSLKSANSYGINNSNANTFTSGIELDNATGDQLSAVLAFITGETGTAQQRMQNDQTLTTENASLQQRQIANDQAQSVTTLNAINAANNGMNTNIKQTRTGSGFDNGNITIDDGSGTTITTTGSGTGSGSTNAGSGSNTNNGGSSKVNGGFGSVGTTTGVTSSGSNPGQISGYNPNNALPPSKAMPVRVAVAVTDSPKNNIAVGTITPASNGVINTGLIQSIERLVNPFTQPTNSAVIKSVKKPEGIQVANIG